MATQTNISPARRLFDLLQDQQEPFLLDIYLLEHGLFNRLQNLETSSRCWPYNPPTKTFQRSLSHGLKKRRQGILMCTRILRSIFTKLRHGKTKRDVNLPENAVFEHSHCVYEEERKIQFSESDRLSSLNSSATISSFSDSTDTDESPSAQPSQISKDGEPQKDKKQFSSASEGFMVSESMLEYLVQSLGFCSYEKPMWVLKQTKQLLMDCVREAVENQQERQGRCCHEEIICEEVLSWAKHGGNATNVSQLVGLDVASFTKERKQLHDQIDEVGVEIGDAICEEIKDEVVSDMIKFFCSSRR
ncbi:hypothetical protein QJS04_geneDACA022079 [Acorus gramineus]|uniref:DUF4378 domain-containing protein n=1 Tax=Acorus gramineus TaxID=55184 RepID=A0AAV9AWJ7_ACOGR|nr:hypothetical protein QJS04_geneDACA022079 [Acorus gramineus]